MPVTDEDLVAAVAAGDREAFGALYRRRRPDVYRFAMHMIGVTGAAEDVAQDVFMTVIHEARRYDPRRMALKGVYFTEWGNAGAEKPSRSEGL